MRWIEVLFIISGIAILVGAIPLAVTLVRPFRSPRAQRWFPLPWENERYLPRQRRRKQGFYVGGALIMGLGTLLRGLLGVFGYQSGFAVWLHASTAMLAATLMLATLLIRPQAR